MAGTMGAAAQSFEETKRWLENEKCGYAVMNRYEESVYPRCKVFFDGRVNLEFIWVLHRDEHFASFYIQDVNIIVEKGETFGLGALFYCQNNSNCIRYRMNIRDEITEEARWQVVLPIANYEESGNYTDNARERASELARGFLYYQRLIAER